MLINKKKYMTDKEIFDKCVEYVDYFISKFKGKDISEYRTEYLSGAYMDCNKYFEKLKKGFEDKGKKVKDDTIIKEIVKRSMFWQYI